MKKLVLFDKSEEIFDKLPKKYAEIILNSLIAKSLENGSLLQEAKTFMNTEDLEKLFSSFNLKIKTEKIEIKESKNKTEDKLKKINFTKKQEEKEQDFTAFEGFD